MPVQRQLFLIFRYIQAKRSLFRIQLLDTKPNRRRNVDGVLFQVGAAPAADNARMCCVCDWSGARGLVIG